MSSSDGRPAGPLGQGGGRYGMQAQSLAIPAQGRKRVRTNFQERNLAEGGAADTASNGIPKRPNFILYINTILTRLVRRSLVVSTGIPRFLWDKMMDTGDLRHAKESERAICSRRFED